MTTALILDLLIAGLLCATIVFCWRLNRRLAALRKGREELRGLIQSLNEATSRAEAGIQQLKDSAKDAGEALKGDIKSARTLRDELSLITETGNNLADRLEGRLTAGSGNAAKAESVDLSAVRAARKSPRGRPANVSSEMLDALKQAR